MSKTFSVSEAQTLLPVLGALLRKAQAAAELAGRTETEMQQLNRRIFFSGGLHVNVAAAARTRAERETAVQEAKDTIAEIEAIGVRIHDLGAGLLDLPCQADDGMVLLCWTLGEPGIQHWHREGEGLNERQPVQRLFGRSHRDRPN